VKSTPAAKPVAKPAAVKPAAAAKPAPSAKATAAEKSGAIAQALLAEESNAAPVAKMEKKLDRATVLVQKKSAQKKAAKKPKLVRDSFTFPASDYALIAALKQRAIGAGVDVKKSELIRAGLAALVALSDEQLLAVVNSLEKIKTGRPAK
jgi:hypothetical protein